MSRRSVGVLLVGLLLVGCARVHGATAAATSQPRVAAAREIAVDDQAGAAQLGALDVAQYEGRWQRIRGAHDGRSNGTSTRSFHRGDAVQFNFIGSRVSLHGISGPNGGRALVGVDREPGQLVDFYAPTKRIDGAQWTWTGAPSHELHTLVIIVAGKHDARSHGDYVNIDDITVAGE